MTRFLQFILTASLMVGNAVAEDQNRKGAPNKIGKGQSNSSSRQSIRKPLNLEKGTAPSNRKKAAEKTPPSPT